MEAPQAIAAPFPLQPAESFRVDAARLGAAAP